MNNKQVQLGMMNKLDRTDKRLINLSTKLFNSTLRKKGTEMVEWSVFHGTLCVTYSQTDYFTKFSESLSLMNIVIVNAMLWSEFILTWKLLAVLVSVEAAVIGHSLIIKYQIILWFCSISIGPFFLFSLPFQEHWRYFTSFWLSNNEKKANNQKINCDCRLDSILMSILE